MSALEMETDSALELCGITKRFGATVANKDVTIALNSGGVLGVLGENGAGKSTLMNVLSGLIAPDSGEIRLNGVVADIRSPRDAIELGIGMVHQHFKLVSTLTVTENVVLGDRQRGGWRFEFESAKAKIRQMGRDIGLPVDTDARVDELDIAGQQRIEIVKALYRDAHILILDEPTAVLTRPESERLFAVIRKLKAVGRATILISHKLDDIFAVCDRVAVMRRGEVVANLDITETSAAELIQLMVGEDIREPRRRKKQTIGPPLLVAEDLSVQRDNGLTAFNGAHFDIKAGEIVAVAGVEGNGQRELAEAITGLRPTANGRLQFDGMEYGPRANSRRARVWGIRHVAEDRLGCAVLPEQSLVENYMLIHYIYPLFNRFGWLRRKPADQGVSVIVRDYDVRTPTVAMAIRSLSGGNQQKVVLGRELTEGARFLVAAHPTRGLDVRTISFIRGRLLAMRDRGLGVLLITSDLHEAWQLADRIMVLANGSLKGPVPLEETNIQEVGGWMAGQ